MIFIKKSSWVLNFLFLGGFVLSSSFASAKPFEGLSLPSFNDGEVFDSAKLAAQDITVVQFWADWCGACKKNIKDIYAVQSDVPFKFVAANVNEDKSSADKFFVKQEAKRKAKKKTTIPAFKKDAYYDTNKKLKDQLKAKTLPTIVVLDKDGTELGRLTKRLTTTKIKEFRAILAKAQTVRAVEKEGAKNASH